MCQLQTTTFSCGSTFPLLWNHSEFHGRYGSLPASPCPLLPTAHPDWDWCALHCPAAEEPDEGDLTLEVGSECGKFWCKNGCARSFTEDQIEEGRLASMSIKGQPASLERAAEEESVRSTGKVDRIGKGLNVDEKFEGGQQEER